MIFRIKSILFFLFIGISAIAQTSLFSLDTTAVFQNSNGVLSFPLVGGFNSPVFCQLDLNGDGANDILVLDRVGNRISTFLFNSSAGPYNYLYSPAYISKIPPIHDWVSSYDFDCDGDLDLFTYFNNSIGVWRNDFTQSGGLSFSLYSFQLTSQYASGIAPIYSTQVNLSAFEDVDNDGDMDILTFTNSGNFIEYHKNYSIDSLGTCGQLIFKVEPDCWGHFRLSGLTNSALLNQNCVTNRMSNRESHLHSGSALTVLDQDCDGDVDLINGDILGSNLLYLENGGTADSAVITQQDSIFPAYNVSVNLQNLPAAFYFDADGDNIKDLIVTPFATVGEDLRNVLFYKNTGSNCQNNFTFVKNNFLIDQMVDVGTCSNVAFFDVDTDGKKDLIIGNDYAYNANPVLQYSSLSYYKNTGTSGLASFQLVTNDWLNLSALTQFGLYPAFGDLDGDNDEDLLLGNADGTLIFYENIGGAIPNFILSSPVFQSIDVGNNAAPQIIDVDRDGKNDLLIGERSGVLNYYKNNSSGTNLLFSIQTSNFGGVNVTGANAITGYSCPQLFDNGNGYELLVGSEAGTIFHYQNIDNNLTGLFVLTDSVFDNINEPKRVTVSMADYNLDGKKDLMLGNGAGGLRGYLGQMSNSVSENKNADLYFEAWPNPLKSENVMFLKFNTPINNANIVLMDVIGNIVFETILSNIYTPIDLSKIQSGTYLLSVKKDGRVFSKKIIKL